MSNAPLPVLSFRSAAVLGAGVMGAQIAAHLANVGLHVELLDVAAKEGAKNGTVEQLFGRAQKLSPGPFYAADVAARVRLGNFEEHWERVAHVDWVIEVVVENLEIKRQLLARLEPTVRADAVVSTNTSGLPIHQISAACGADFRRRFLGTHFFNPPRYMKLLELVPTPATDAAVLARVREFARVHLGKDTVIAKDTPNFVANRIGVFAMLQAVRHSTALGFAIDEVDVLTGPLIGRPKSATFRTCDVVGLDTLAYVAQNLYAAVPEDESRAAFVVPEVIQQLVAAGALGQKAGRGFYKKTGKHILFFDSKTSSYVASSSPELTAWQALEKSGPLVSRLRALWSDPGRAGALFRAVTVDTLAYAAARIPEITDSPADLDRAMRCGFGYQLGPFATWDALGFDVVLGALRHQQRLVPSWVEDLARQGGGAFYRDREGSQEVWLPNLGYRATDQPADQRSLAQIKTQRERVVWEGDQAALVDLGDGVACFEFRSKANTLSAAVIASLLECIARVEQGRWLGMVIGNDAEHFSPGANLAEMAAAVQQGQFVAIDQFVGRFQQAMQRVSYAVKPVVVATQGRVLGGACEMLLACPHPVVAAESNVGLVEVGAGLIPAGGGTMRMVAQAAERAASKHPERVLPFLLAAFETLARATVASSALHAQHLGFVAPGACIVHHGDRRLFVAKHEVQRLAVQGYLPPAERTAIRVLGEPARAPLLAGIRQLRLGGQIDQYTEFLADRLAFVMTGGEVAGPTDVHEQDLLDLEREVFVSLLQQKGTQQRIAAILGPRT